MSADKSNADQEAFKLFSRSFIKLYSIIEYGGFLNWIFRELQKWACCSATILFKGDPGLLTLYLSEDRQYPKAEL